ncbi:uncharacterized protein [Haliotis asinina]|uniref:uncharacterized protein n=1 Tax=Haliotis asinina TaxID=109174 RepID=UPI00353252DB
MMHADTTTLPQHDPERRMRQQLLEKARNLYESDNSNEEIPVKVLQFPPEEEFSAGFIVRIGLKAVLLFFARMQVWLGTLIRWVFQQLGFIKKIHSVDQVETIYKEPGYPVPKYVL